LPLKSVGTAGVPSGTCTSVLSALTGERSAEFGRSGRPPPAAVKNQPCATASCVAFRLFAKKLLKYSWNALSAMRCGSKPYQGVAVSRFDVSGSQLNSRVVAFSSPRVRQIGLLWMLGAATSAVPRYQSTIRSCGPPKPKSMPIEPKS